MLQIERYQIVGPPTVDEIIGLVVREWASNKVSQIVALTIEAVDTPGYREDIQFELSLQPRITGEGALVAYGLDPKVADRRQADKYVLRAEPYSEERAELMMIRPSKAGR